MKRRDVLWAALASQAILVAPARASRVPVSKNHQAYTQMIDRLCFAWWARDFDAFDHLFRHEDVNQPFNARPLFDQRYVERERRFRGPILFNGASAIVQVVTPRGADPEHGIGGGYATADLFLIKFFPGIDDPVIEELQFVDSDLLAADEWRKLPGAR